MRFPAAPSAVRLRGRGMWTCGQNQAKSSFTLVRQLHGSWFVTPGLPAVMFLGPHGGLALDGRLQDGRPIRCERAFATESQIGGEDEGCLIFANWVEIGERSDGNPSQVIYPLIGHFEGSAKVEDDGWIIEIDPDNRAASKEAIRTSRVWLVPAEGMNLTLKHPDASLEEYDRKSSQVTKLLSLADGMGVTTYRHLASWEEDKHLEVLRQHTGDELGPGHIVPCFQLQQFLAACLPTWRSMPNDRRSAIELVLHHINTSAHGYLDTRLLSMAQAWEIMANVWVADPPLSTAQSCLLTLVKCVYRRWRKMYPETDRFGVLMDRLSKGLRWPPILGKMQRLASRVEIDRVGLSLKDLKQVRDGVVHNGVMPERMRQDRSQALSLLTAARLGLQLVVLAELGYTGQVVTATPNDWTAFDPIGDFLAQAVQ